MHDYLMRKDKKVEFFFLKGFLFLISYQIIVWKFEIIFSIIIFYDINRIILYVFYIYTH